MPETTITQLPDPSGFSSDPFTDVLRDGARKLIEQANRLPEIIQGVEFRDGLRQLQAVA
jgi:hypothetical protein